MSKGFTVMELLIGLAVFLLISGIAGVSLHQAYNRFSLVSADSVLMGALTSAARRARSGEQDSSWGVYLPYDSATRFMDSLVIFSGSTYATRTISFDETRPFPTSVALPSVDFSGVAAPTGNDHEIVFSRFSGATNQYGSVEMQFADRTIVIGITKDGLIAQEL